MNPEKSMSSLDEKSFTDNVTENELQAREKPCRISYQQLNYQCQ
jgi:hypothetical protein